MQAAEGEAVAEHEGDEVVVDVVGEHLLVALDDVVEYLEVHLALREAAARVDGHGLVEDAFGDLAVAAVYAAVVDVEGVAAVALDDLYVGPFAEQTPEGAAHVLQRAFDLAAFAGVGGGGLGDAHGGTEDLTEHVPEAEHVLFADALGGYAQEQAEVVGFAYLEAPTCELALTVGYAAVPVFAYGAQQHAVFLTDVFARHELDAAEAHAVAAADEVAELDERVAPVARVEGKAEVVVEPFALEQCGGTGIFAALGVDDAVLLLQYDAFALGYAAVQVEVYEAVGIDVVEEGAVGVVGVDGCLPCLAPEGDVFLGEGIGLLHETRGEAYGLALAGEAFEGAECLTPHHKAAEIVEDIHLFKGCLMGV